MDATLVLEGEVVKNGLWGQVCRSCDQLKTADSFSLEPRTKLGYQVVCKECKRAQANEGYRLNADAKKKQAKEWRVNNKGGALAISKRWRDSHKEQQENLRLQYHYGITYAEYYHMLGTQEGVCALCRKECRTGSKLCVDHDHRTGEVRGLLCRTCNSAIGFMQDDVEVLKNAIKYLTQ